MNMAIILYWRIIQLIIIVITTTKQTRLAATISTTYIYIYLLKQEQLVKKYIYDIIKLKTQICIKIKMITTPSHNKSITIMNRQI